MRSFAALFPEIAARETLVLRIAAGQELPAGEYGFCEMYCSDPECDCRRVLLTVHGVNEHADWAVINYGWEPAAFYAQWARCPPDYAARMTRPMLDRCHEQSPYAPVLLCKLSLRLPSRVYDRRFAEHYQLFKKRLLFLTRSGRLPVDW